MSPYNSIATAAVVGCCLWNEELESSTLVSFNSISACRAGRVEAEARTYYWGVTVGSSSTLLAHAIGGTVIKHATGSLLRIWLDKEKKVSAWSRDW